MAKDVANTYVDRDGNFVEQLQTSAFDARLWELYLHACLVEWGFALDNTFEAPDYVASKDGKWISLRL